MTDPATRNLIAREREARDYLTAAPEWAAVRRQALLDLHKTLGSWTKVAEATGQTMPAVYKAAMQPHKKGTTA